MKNVFVRAASIAAVALPLALPALASASTTTARPLLDPVQQIVAAARQHPAATTAVGNFNFPYALATDAGGNLYVASLYGANVKRVNTALAVQTGSIATAPYPLSMAVDPTGNIYVGTAESFITKYNAHGTSLGNITANASNPASLAVDQYEDLYIGSSSGVAIDDIAGESVTSNIFSSTAVPTVTSVAIGGPFVYPFYAGSSGIVAGTFAMRGFPAHPSVGPLPEQAALGSACSPTAICWFDDYNAKTLTHWGMPDAPSGVSF